MKKVTETSNWKRYKESNEGKEVIALFNHIATPDATVEEMLEVIKRFDPELTQNMSKKEEKQYLDALSFFDNILKDNLPEKEEEWKDFKYGEFFAWLTHSLAVEDESVELEDAPQIGFKKILGSNIFLSMVLYAYMPECFLPNLYVMQFAYFKKFAEKYELKLPETPHRSDYRMRWFYYLEMCNILDKFADDNGFVDSGEICAFLYDFELTNIKEEMESDHKNQLPVVPEQAWILVGNYSDGEKSMESGFWQSNELTHKGDIMLFYEKSPVKKLNAVWRALEDGFVDPFGHFYSYSVIGQKIEIPDDKAITFDEFKQNEYFNKDNRGTKGNYVSKNFQDVSGWPVTYEDYAEIKRILEAKGFDTSVLPSLYEPKALTGGNIELESDVSWKLLVPLLEEMGWKYKEDFYDEVEFPAGRGTTGHQMDKRPDFCLHLKETDTEKEAQVVIEVKLNMKNTEEIHANYKQGVSYAKWGEAKVLVLCDKNQIRVYERTPKGKFDENKWIRFRWEEMQNLEKYNELKRILSKK